MENNPIITKNDKNNYGIIYTPDNIVNEILDQIDNNYFMQPKKKWLDVGAGLGIFSDKIIERLEEGLQNYCIDSKKRRDHILKNMVYLNEIYPPHISFLKNKFENNINLLDIDFLSLNTDFKFDFIVGNPPYNVNGQIKTPTNCSQKKTDDGKQIYHEFIKKSLELVKENGFLVMIIPSLWLKPDKAKLYNILTNKKLLYLRCFSASETNKMFNYEAQTPTCFFILQNTSTIDNPVKSLKIYDKIEKLYINFDLKLNGAIPTNGINIINKIDKWLKEFGNIKFYKSNLPSKNTKISDTFNSTDFSYQNIKTCILNKLNSEIIINYSNKKQAFYGDKKLILAHKMYGFPYLDLSGDYGISTRDNYIISDKDYSIEDLKKIQNFLSTKTAIFLFSTTNYRMRYLERYAFEFIPDITKIIDFPDLNNLNMRERDEKIWNYFKFSKRDKDAIDKQTKDYNLFV